MIVETHIIKLIQIAEVKAEGLIIQSSEDGLDLMGDLYYQGFDRVIIYANTITPDFFNLKNGIAGEILQKFANYRMRLVIVGDFSSLKKQSIKDFIFESNKGNQVNFLSSIKEALNALAN
ncbi:DUF4180 domain-containing protein [Crocinitomix catalasitica]|uniref:DUF4180 domain-containing protein n=1 Tax=Crocinitomix catalasitica TaxID=184607 RepID=UPI0004857CEB|nr:DUF4180 domain-containing protein [Crocinitomix catalasitica]